MDYSVSELISITEGQLIQGKGHLSINRIYIDSRKIWLGNNSCFLALNGINFNAHDFIHKAHGFGIRVFIVSEDRLEWRSLENAEFIYVPNTVVALQKISENHRRKFTFPIIGITGSNGKTTVKEWLSQALYSKYRVVKTPKSYNSQIGVPLSVFQMDNEHEIGVFEAGISHLNEMSALANILRPDIGIFTNIGNAHDEYFNSDEEKAYEKAQLFRDCKTIVFCADNDLIARAIKDHSSQKLSWSEHSIGQYNFSVSKDNADVATCVFKSKTRKFHIPFSDLASRQNVFHIIILLWHLGYSENEINEELASLKRIKMRLESVEGMSNSLLINDVYNSDMTSFEAAIELFKNENTKSQKHLILSDFKNTGISPEKITDIIKAQMKDVEINSVHLIGNDARKYRPAFNGASAHLYSDTDDFLSKNSSLDFRDSAVLIKGSRSFQLERITEKFQRKTHRTVLEINLSSILENLNYYRSKLNEGVRITVMVKAFSYGSGVHEVASVLENNNVDYLAVAYVDEAIALREKNITMPIIVMNPEEAPLELFIEHRLEPVVHSWESFEYFSNRNAPIPIHIKIDTGMHRLGFLEKEIPRLISELDMRNMLVASVFTHLSSSENEEHDKFTIQQLNTFRRIKSQFSESKNIVFHAINSSGITRFPESQFDMVRLGIGLYGYSLVEADKAFLHPAITLKSTISQIKTIEAGESVGYSRAYVADEKTRVGILPIGYADGLHRSFGNGKGTVFLNGNRLKVIGNICMDMCMIDLENTECTIGDEAEFFGSNKAVEETAIEMGTIVYEVLSTISQRVKRTFYFD